MFQKSGFHIDSISGLNKTGAEKKLSELVLDE